VQQAIPLHSRARYVTTFSLRTKTFAAAVPMGDAKLSPICEHTFPICSRDISIDWCRECTYTAGESCSVGVGGGAVVVVVRDLVAFENHVLYMIP
jgi:hypothetical protein